MKASVAFLTVSAFLICGCFQLYPDSPIEEQIEESLKEVTGIDIDLTSTDGK